MPHRHLDKFKYSKVLLCSIKSLRVKQPLSVNGELLMSICVIIVCGDSQKISHANQIPMLCGQ